MVLAGTGHRPERLGGYGWDVYGDLVRFAVQQLWSAAPDRLISGMALGWDLALADAAILVGVPFTAAIPCDNQDDRWRPLWRVHYRRLLTQADLVTTVTPGSYQPWKMQRRNEWMVDTCDSVLALWSGDDGGTANCIRYAQHVGRPINNVWQGWLDFRKQDPQ